jgi:hypothetical protein
VSEQSPDQPPQEDPLAEPRWQPDQPSPPAPYPPPRWESGQQQEQWPSPWQPPGPPPPWGYPVPAAPPPDGRKDRRIIIALAAGGVLLLAALGAGIGLLVAHANRPASLAAAQPVPTTSAERVPVTTSAQRTPETTSPAATSPPAGSDVIKIGTAEYAEYEDGLRLQVTSVRRTMFSDVSTNPGPGVIATVRITNRTRAKVDLMLVDVTVRYGADGVEADSVFDDGVHEFSGGLAVGRTATATYGFAVPRNQRDITVGVTPGFDYDSSTFAGRIG